MSTLVLALGRQLLIGCCLFSISVAMTAAEVGSEAPAFSLRDQSGTVVSLADYRGSLVYVDFWASWCGPCRVSFPVMDQLQSRYAEQGFTVLAINVDQRREDADAFLDKRAVSFPILFDEAGSTPGKYDIKGMPTSFLIGSDGKIIYVHQGFKKSDGPHIEQLVKKALNL